MPDRIAQWTLLSYVIAGLMAVYWDYRRSQIEFGAWLLYATLRLYGGLMFHWRANRRCPFPSHGAAIILANHRSPTDPLGIWMNNHHRKSATGPIRVIGFLMAREYYKMPGLNWICRKMQSIPADRNGQDVGPTREALSRLRSGNLVGIFPEGRLNSSDGLLPFSPGVGWLALRAEVPIYPVYIQGPVARGSMVKPFLEPCRMKIFYGDPIDLRAWKGRKRTPEMMNEVTAHLRGELARLGGLTLDTRDPELPTFERN